MISGKNETAMRTRVNTNRQVFGNNLAAARTHLRRAARVNPWRQPASFRRFVGCKVHELTPGGVGDALVHTAPVPILHVGDVQVLEGNDLELVDQSPTELVCKVPSSVGDTVVDVLDNTLAFATLRRSLLGFAQSALRFGQSLLIMAKEARVGDMLASRESGKMSQANVHADGFVNGRQRLRFDDAGEVGIPVAECVSADSERLGLADDGPMQLDLDVADLGETQASIIQESPIAFLLGIGERIVAIISTKSWIARFLACLHTAKKGLEGKIEAGQGFLHSLGMALSQPRMFCFPDGKHLHSVVSGYRTLFLLPGVLARFQPLVICPATAMELAL